MPPSNLPGEMGGYSAGGFGGFVPRVPLEGARVWWGYGMADGLSRGHSIQQVHALDWVFESEDGEVWCGWTFEGAGALVSGAGAVGISGEAGGLLHGISR